MDVVALIGRILFLTQSAAMAGAAQSKGVPAPRVAVRATGVMQLGALVVILGAGGDLGGLLLTAFLTPRWFWDDARVLNGNRPADTRRR